MKLIIFLCLITLSLTQTVLNKNACNACTQLKSQVDCTLGRVSGCEWATGNSTNSTTTTGGNCQVKSVITYTAYCPTVSGTTCAQTTGCAYVDSKCTHFTGCSAYTKTTTAECQAITYECVSDGERCITAGQCTDYKTQTICESTPSISGILKCKWDSTTNACRDYVCAEADSTLATDAQCDDWLSGCVSRGKGCWSKPLPLCSAYSGDATTCATYIGSDGNCELATGATNCQAKVCTNAPTTTNTDADCKTYQKGCITTGKGCIGTALPQCSSYQGDSSTCVGYIGIDGVCEGDAGGTQCRARKCENGTFTTDADCDKYKSGCKTTGKACTATLGLCSSYQGTSTTCAGLVGTDGYCKGTSTTTSGNCTPKLCEDAPTTTTTDTACAAFQVGCKTTGQGCLKTLASCTTYTGDSSSCASRIGSEGNCTWASGTNCVARNCAGAASTVNTNQNCSKWFTNCVTNGAGCVSTTTCDLTIKDLSCQGTTGCSWQPICTSNSGCSAYTNSISICSANKARVFDYNKYTYKADGVTIDTTTAIYKFVNCAWRSGSCVQMECSDLTGTYYATDANCNAALTGCISNGKDACISKNDCSKLTGTIDTCKGYAAYCTNTAGADTKAACISRKCADNTDATDTSTCNSWLPGCITNGQGCVDYNTLCTSFQGTQSTCNTLYGYLSGTITSFKTVQCYNTSAASKSDYCVVKTCPLATGKTSDSDCSSFLEGCAFDGKDSCVLQSTSICSDYNSGTAGNYCDQVQIKGKSAKYCYGSAANTSCKVRECSDNTTADQQTTCDSFKTGCILKSAGGCDDVANVRCESQQGTLTTCPTLFGSLSSDTSKKIKCTRVDVCQDRQCSDLASPTQASDCTTYKSTCRFVKAGSPCIPATTCSSYNVPDSAANNATKFTYCSSITDNSGNYCGFVKDAGTCSTRTCDQFLASTYTTTLTCPTYIDKTTTGTGTCQLSGTSCQVTKSDCAYTVDTTALTDDASKLAYCKIFTNDKSVPCSYVSGSTCTLQTTCETIVTNTDTKTCNDFLPSKEGICQKATNANCIETLAACTSYTIPSTVTDAQKPAFCQSLKAVNDVANFGTGKALYKSCAWVSGSTCSYLPCASITSAVSQADCDAQTIGCYYYNGKCQGAVAAGNCPTTYPPGLSNSQIALYCMSIYETGVGYCQVKDDQTGCVTTANTDCTYTFLASGNWNGVAVTAEAYCREHSDKTKKIHCIKDTTANATKCKAGTCDDIASPTNQADCDKYVLGCYYIHGACVTIGTGMAAAGDCTDTGKVTFGSKVPSASTAADKISYCQSYFLSDKTAYCTYDSIGAPTATACAAAKANCNQYAGTDAVYCQSKINLTGVQCTFTTGATACRNFDCSDITSAKSQIDCDQNQKGLACQYFKGTCYSTLGCSYVTASGSQITDKQTYCESLTSNNVACTYITGTFCADQKANCSGYNVSGITAVADKLSTCLRVNATTDIDCTFVQKDSATTCVKLDDCTNYVVTATKEAAQCPLVLSKDGYPCKAGTSGACAALTCPDITTGALDCTKNAAGCVYSQQTCLTKVACASYTIPGTLSTTTQKKSWCETITNASGNLCKWDGTQCADRACADATYITDFDCNNYLKGCKTDGKKCVDKNYPCGSSSGDAAYCNSLVDQNGKDKCAPKTTASTDTAACTARSCYDNVTATTDVDCNDFMERCATKGTGCIPNTSTCDQYRGTKLACENFKQSITTDGVTTYQFCSGNADNTATSPCKNRVCSDNTILQDKKACGEYLTGCVTNGAGCIEYTAACTAYKGTNAQCVTFMGNSGTDYCQGTANDATTVAACKKRLCTDISATNNKGCYDGMPPFKDTNGKDVFVFCVFDGTKSCVDNNKTCSFFKGNVDTCATYTATDGPCKATTIGSIVGTCAKRVCTEAPNTLTTDDGCKEYHPSCLTTGFGCTTTSSCSSLTNQTSCSSRVSCTWANQCKSAVTSCSSFSNTSQSQCVNTKVNGYYCAWSETGNVCRAQTCADQPGTIKDHATCQAFSDTCTTSGAGCVTLTACSYYTVQSVCLAASTTKDGVGRCGWENNVCRPRACGDKSATSTAECDTFLSGCQTNGTTCVAANTCTDFNGNQAYCLKSNKGPCLYVSGICYDYTQCEDAPGKTHSICQAFSPLCTTNGTTCIPITSCEKTTLKASCFVGTDGQCGWLPAGGTNATEKCQKFGQCTDATGATNDVCYAYGSTCISDGTACIAQSTCSNYKTQIACNNNGTDGICFWNATNNACKLKECGDATANNTSNDGCASFTVASGSCTTDGTKCIVLSTCSSYVEAGCVQGTDGVCIFALAVGVTTGTTKSCRLKACEDITGGTTNAACIGISPKKCVSNGTSCIAKAACTSYTTKSACNGGGVDGTGADVTCAFTVTDATKPNIGTCKQFTQCSDANNDSAACATKAGVCQWKVTGTTSSCTAYTCDTITTGTSCQPVPSFDGTSYTVCNLSSSTGKCATADPGIIADTNCYTKSAYTYSWNTATSKCVSCIAGSTTPTNNSTNTNNTNTTNDTTTTYGYLLGAMTLGLLGLMA